MKNKSKSGFIVGLLGLLAGIPIGFYAFYVFILLFALSGAPEAQVYTAYLIPLAGIVAIIALCFYFKKAKIGGIIMLIAFAMYMVPFILVFVLPKANITTIIVQYLIGLIPGIMLLISSLLALKSKK